MRGFIYEAYKLLNEGYKIDSFNNIPIYWDEFEGIVYIYTKDKGKGKIQFPNIKEAIEYIKDNDNLTEDESKNKLYTIFFVTSSDSSAQIDIYAESPRDARNKAKQKLGKKCFRIVDVIPYD